MTLLEFADADTITCPTCRRVLNNPVSKVKGDGTNRAGATCPCGARFEFRF